MSKEYKSITGSIMGSMSKARGAAGLILVIGLPLFIVLDVIFYTLFVLVSNKENKEEDTDNKTETSNTEYSGTWGWYNKKLAEDKEKNGQIDTNAPKDSKNY